MYVRQRETHPGRGRAGGGEQRAKDKERVRRPERVSEPANKMW